jgi:hypothetical protein
VSKDTQRVLCREPKGLRRTGSELFSSILEFAWEEWGRKQKTSR